MRTRPWKRLVTKAGGWLVAIGVGCWCVSYAALVLGMADMHRDERWFAFPLVAAIGFAASGFGLLFLGEEH